MPFYNLLPHAFNHIARSYFFMLRHLSLSHIFELLHIIPLYGWNMVHLINSMWMNI